ncbi:MAG: hypothetical protein HY744_24425 [Deltaproteobacteria bacterium]|nr:hypothetical protein [Deltaproteobacteria bacterium]
MDDACRLYDLPQAERNALLVAVGAALGRVASVRLGYAFGSFARGEKFRDLDLALLLDPAAAWWEPAEAAQQAWQAAGRPPWDIDVIALDDAAVVFRRGIVLQAGLIFEREAGQARAYEVRVLSLASDLSAWIGAREAERGLAHG